MITRSRGKVAPVSTKIKWFAIRVTAIPKLRRKCNLVITLSNIKDSSMFICEQVATATHFQLVTCSKQFNLTGTVVFTVPDVQTR
jgi:hypothetical protein